MILATIREGMIYYLGIWQGGDEAAKQIAGSSW